MPMAPSSAPVGWQLVQGLARVGHINQLQPQPLQHLANIIHAAQKTTQQHKPRGHGPASGTQHPQSVPGQHMQPQPTAGQGLRPGMPSSLQQPAQQHLQQESGQTFLHGKAGVPEQQQQRQQLAAQRPRDPICREASLGWCLPMPARRALHDIWGPYAGTGSRDNDRFHNSSPAGCSTLLHCDQVSLFQQGWDRVCGSSSSSSSSWRGPWQCISGSSRSFARRAVAQNANAGYILEELNKLREGDESQGSLTPAAVVERLDRVIIGQEDAKKAVAIAFRNRWRRQQVTDADMRREITPKNLLLIGPTGCGKTEIARRLAKLAEAPFIKVEATKFTEVGYHGRDVDQIVRDLVEAAIGLVKKRCKKAAAKLIADAVEHTIISALLPSDATAADEAELRRKYRAGELDQERVNIDVPQQRNGGEGPGLLVQGGHMSVSVSLAGVMGAPPGAGGPTASERRNMTVAEARELLEDVEAETVLPPELLSKEAVRVAEQEGIVFLDEIDKIVNPSGAIRHGTDPSAEGVQRDLLPLIEGSVVNTKHGPVATDHILFIASGAFTVAKPSDMMAELQGRLPIRVELRGLTAADFERILTEPECSMIYQQQRLLGCEGVKLEFTSDAVKELAAMAEQINKEVENIGARRLHTVLERLVEDISFEAPDKVAEAKQAQAQQGPQAAGLVAEVTQRPQASTSLDAADKIQMLAGVDFEYTYVVDKQQVQEKLNSLLQQEDFNKYIL